MLRFLPVLALLCCLTPAGQAEEPYRSSLTRWDIEGMYVRAKALLEDRDISNVESVPVLLDTCFRAGYAPAARLLPDVYEGKFKGLEEKPEQAFETVSQIVEHPLPDPNDEDLKRLHREALFRLALYLEKGYGCTADPVAAFQRMTQAAVEGYGPARVELARYLMTGRYTEPQPEQAWRLLLEQAKEDPTVPHLFFYMGYMCYKGVGRQPDPRLAARIFLKGAQVNDADCMNNLGAICEKGITMRPNPELALFFYRRAAALGHKQASANLQRLSFKVGTQATRKSENTPAHRISNALQHVVCALPMSDTVKNALLTRLKDMADPAR